MVVECSWNVRWLNKPVPYILRWFGRGCDDVYINVALHLVIEGEPYRIVFLKKGGPLIVPDSAHDPPPAPDDGHQRRVMEEPNKWHLPGGICRDNDQNLFDWLWSDINAKLGLSIIEVTALIHSTVVIVDNENGEGERKVLALTVAARHVRDIPLTRYTAHGFSEHRWCGEEDVADEDFPMRKCAALRRHLQGHLNRLELARSSRRFPRLPILTMMPGLFPKFP
ncbi:hypothetical protein F4782DRAFT_200370 [Xylaria castorea]|nr:hypothetical protein F4782DRAFT_200370 [Xylaria castorea]